MEIMIDIETLDTRPTAVVLSFAAVAFPDTEVDPLYRALDVDQQLAVGRTVSADTLAWWARQPDEARLAALAAPAPHLAGLGSRCGSSPEGAWWAVEQALSDLELLFGHHNVEAVWACPPTFDIAILESLYEDFGRSPVPWTWRQFRDVRTLREEAGVDGDHPPLSVADAPMTLAADHCVPHHPVWDCYRQIAVVREARRRMNKR